MSIFTKYIEPPLHTTEEIFKSSIKSYFMKIQELFLEAGFVRANISNNMDFNNINFPLYGYVSPKLTPSGENRSTSVLSFDYNDAYQETLPLRVSIGFGIFKNSASTSYPIFTLFDVTVGIIDKNTNGFIVSKNFMSLQNTYAGTNGTTGTPVKKYEGGFKSSIIVNDKITAFSITPEIFESPNGSYNNSYLSAFIEFAVERISDTYVNIYHRNSSSFTSNSYVTNTIMGDGKTTTASSFYIYTDLNSWVSNGKLLTFPVFNIDGSNNMTQSSNILLCKKGAVPTSGFIDIVVDENTTSRFMGLSGTNSGSPDSNSRLLIRVD